MRRIAVLGLVLVLGAGSTLAPGSAGAGSAPAAGEVRYLAPVTPMTVVRGFDPPLARYGSGHLGVDLAVPVGAAVRAAGDGVVSFAGSVAGRGLVVVQHADGVRTEYEPVRAALARGDVVRRGELLGRVAGRHGDCPADRCLHWGARRGVDYLDPLLLLHRLGAVRLLPWPR